ncbi:hypothetical protein G647_01752 [Cladophialophora carrionii CBS 160.54]|uniref:Myb-like DNA-binding domain-containing protein n=1 Tax=Cladophialophora carrionii CBS 160.54 TaxID=1279043 RepID=V9DQX0_9EURO|nr:uncharacterized protein G647_01752 [Cladophialophora carrionii CBS 160.54]ETI29299.1 hypothetical protein G647_01752 [Cladophialophora carrionii CBS 160.54]
MASTEDNKLTFVMMVLKNSDMKPDWKAIATEAGISLPGNAQAKLRKIAQAAGYKLVNGNQIVELDGTEDAAKTATAAPTKKRKSPTKKEKVAKDESSNETATESPSKKTKLTQVASDSAQEEVKQEVKDEEA